MNISVTICFVFVYIDKMSVRSSRGTILSLLRKAGVESHY